MSRANVERENVEVVRALFEAWNAGGMDRLGQFYDPDVIVRAPDDWPEPGPFVGTEAVMRQWNEMRKVWSADSLEPASDFVACADRVLVRFTWRGAGRGPDTDLTLTGVWTIRNGRIFDTEFSGITPTHLQPWG
jgi:ketosteroid isomerase-like protein